MKQEYLNLCNQPKDKAEKCLYCEKYWLSMENYQYNSLYICKNWDVWHNKCQFLKRPDLEKVFKANSSHEKHTLVEESFDRWFLQYIQQQPQGEEE